MGDLRKVDVSLNFVMPGLVPGIHALVTWAWTAGSKPGHDG